MGGRVFNLEISCPVLHCRQVVLAWLHHDWPLVLLKVSRWLLLRAGKFPLRVAPYLRCGQARAALIKTAQLLELSLLVAILGGVVLRASPRLIHDHLGALLAPEVPWNYLLLLGGLICSLGLLLWLLSVG